MSKDEAKKEWEAFTSASVTNCQSDQAKLISRLKKPEGKVDVVIDTDTYNEIDDQFALAYLIKSDEKLNLKAIYAAPFFNQKSSGPADGMEKSYQEILRVLTLMGKEDLKDVVFRGSTQYMPSEEEPVLSDASKDLAARAMEYTEENPLYVIAIGAITNVSSALLMKPEIKDRIVLICLSAMQRTGLTTKNSIYIRTWPEPESYSDVKYRLYSCLVWELCLHSPPADRS